MVSPPHLVSIHCDRQPATEEGQSRGVEKEEGGGWGEAGEEKALPPSP